MQVKDGSFQLIFIASAYMYLVGEHKVCTSRVSFVTLYGLVHPSMILAPSVRQQAYSPFTTNICIAIARAYVPAIAQFHNSISQVYSQSVPWLL